RSGSSGRRRWYPTFPPRCAGSRTTASRWKAPARRRPTASPAPPTACSSSTQNPTPATAPFCCSAKPSGSEPPRTADGSGRRPLPAAGVRRRAPARRSVGRLPEAECRALVVGALGEQAVRLALGLVRLAARRPDPLDRGRDVVDTVGQLHRGLRAFRRQDAQWRPGL